MKARAIPYDKYFGEMGISASDKARRIAFAEGLEDKMITIFALVEIYSKYGMLTQSWLEKEVYNTYLSYVGQFLTIDQYIERHVREFAEYISVNTVEKVPNLMTFDEINALKRPENTQTYTAGNTYSRNNPAASEYEEYEQVEDAEEQDELPWLWYLSIDRAAFIAENESNDMMEYAGYLEAIEDGMTQKTWCTVGDSRVRDAHASTNGQTVGIDDYFLVGDEYGLFPGDTEHLSADNTVNCRCWIEYS